VLNGGSRSWKIYCSQKASVVHNHAIVIDLNFRSQNISRFDSVTLSPLISTLLHEVRKTVWNRSSDIFCRKDCSTLVKITRHHSCSQPFDKHCPSSNYSECIAILALSYYRLRRYVPMPMHSLYRKFYQDTFGRVSRINDWKRIIIWPNIDNVPLPYTNIDREGSSAFPRQR